MSYTKILILPLLAILVTGCDFSSKARNEANGGVGPMANAGADQTVVEKMPVQLDGAATGGQGAISYSWTQTGGPTVTIANADTAAAGFDAPDIAAGSTEVILLRLSITDSAGSTANDTVSVTVTEVAPSANAGMDREARDLSTVILNGVAAGSDTPLVFSWVQIDGIPVTLVDEDQQSASFVAPDVGLNVTEVLTFRFTVQDSIGRNSSDEISISVSEQPTTISISGMLRYEFPSPNPGCDGLDFSNLALRPIRGATVHLVNSASNLIVGATTSDENGQYSFIADSQVAVFVRVRAELKNSSGALWDVEIRDNTSATALPLEQRPLYVLDGPSSAPGGVNEIRDITATTGWTGFGFSGVRAAAPFSILDAIYSSMQLVTSADAAADFAELDVFWSVNNTTAAGDIDIGEIGTSFYLPQSNFLFLLGKDGDDIEDFDHHVISHEWGHFLEAKLSRLDSIGGSHGPTDILDLRVAFSEGFATAFSGMALNDPEYCDAFWVQGVLSGFDIQIEDEITGANAGWYNEASIMKILFDLWDTVDDGADVDSLGFGPIFDVVSGVHPTSDAAISIFSFAEALKLANASSSAFIDALLNDESITANGIDRWGSTETNDAGSSDTLPVYKPATPDGSIQKVCSSSEFDSVGPTAIGNKLNVHQLLKMEITSAQRFVFDAQADAATITSLPADDPNDDTDQSDPDIYIYLLGHLQNSVVSGSLEGTSGMANAEVFTSANPLPVGTYVIDVLDARREDRNTDPNYPLQTCFDLSITAAP